MKWDCKVSKVCDDMFVWETKLFCVVNNFHYFSSLVLSGDGNIGIEEYRQDCVKRMAYSDIKQLDEAYAKLAGVITLSYFILHLLTTDILIINM